ncbi:MAG: glycosyltransferase [archaeon]|nr:glycosyltransferase [archaeon]
MRICWLSNFAFGNVGYSTIVRNLLPKINKIHTSALICNYGIEGAQRIDNLFEGITHYGKGQSGFEEALIPNHVKNFNGDCLISIFDVWALQKMHIELKANNIPYIVYCPVDSSELNPFFMENLNSAFRIIPMSKHSEDCIKKFYPEKTLPHIPGGVNLEIFKPLWNSVEEKNNLKSKFGFSPDTFLISLIGDIKSLRKRWMENLEGIKIFREKNPGIKIGVYIHTNLRVASGLEFNIPMILSKFKIEDICRSVDTYRYCVGISDDEINLILNASDVFLQASYGEGFGLGFLEAAAAGTPSIGTNFSSMKQTVVDGKTGHLVDCNLEWDQSLAKKAVPIPEDIAVKLKMIYDRKSVNYREECIKHASNYSWDKIINEQWIPVLEQLEKDIKNECFNQGEPSDLLVKRSKEIFTVGG